MQGPSTKHIGVNTIKQKLLRPALTSHFRCSFVPPAKTKSFFTDRQIPDTIENQEIIELSCSEASLPGSSIATHELNNDFTGVTERHAYRRLYDDRADFSFYVDRKYTSILFFENWISYIVGENDLKGQESPTYSYRMNYPEDYITQSLFITKFEKDTDPYQRKGINSNASIKQDNVTKTTLRYQFINAFPISITSMPVSYDAAQLLKCTVSFTYSRYVVKNLISNSQGEPGAPDTSAGIPNPYDLTPEDQARYNGAFSNNLSFNQFNISSGTAFNVDNDPTRVFENNALNQIGSNFTPF
jgi:hypothetical protein